MICPNCGSENQEGLKFCGQCAGRLNSRMSDIRCSACGFVNRPNTRYCGACGEAVFPAMTEDKPVSARPRVRTGYVVGGGLTAAVFVGLFYWAMNYTWTEQIWHEVFMGFGYYETVTHSVDPAIQALFLVVAIVGVILTVYGFVSRK